VWPAAAVASEIPAWLYRHIQSKMEKFETSDIARYKKKYIYIDIKIV